MHSLYPAARNLLFKLPAETAHNCSLRALRIAERLQLLKFLFPENECVRPVELMGLRFPNRVGLAAGLDKEGNSIAALGRLGFGFIEIGTITPLPQQGNPKPRLFRLIPHEAIINRMGFNNPGIEVGVKNVRSTKRYDGIVGFNIGKNKITPNERAIDDYLICFRAAYPVADYITVNLSSPNTPGLRELQAVDQCAKLLSALKKEQEILAQEHNKYVPLVLKVAPELAEKQISGLSQVFLKEGLDGLITTNTTLARDAVSSHRYGKESGGLSGAPLRELSTRVLQAFAAELGGHIPIIGVGGICSAADAEEKIKAGAALVQIYTSFIYRGPELIHDCAAALDQI